MRVQRAHRIGLFGVLAVMLLTTLVGSAAAITEIDAPGCRWTISGGTVYIPYTWGGNLQTPGTPWRNAFEAAVGDWNGLDTRIYFYYDNGLPNVTIDTYSRPDGAGGYASYACCWSIPCYYNVYGNTYYDVGYTNNERRAAASHEVGHSQAIGHIPEFEGVALMGYNPDPDVYYTPQGTDEELVNQVYP